MITSDVIFLLALAMFNIFAAGLCYYNADIKRKEENKFSFFLASDGNTECGVCYPKCYWGIATIGINY